MNMISLLAGTILILIVSWFLSIKHKRYHGIPRFFSFESIFILTLLNYRVWFEAPLSPLQILSWLLLVFSIYPVLSGYYLLTRRGNPDANFENTSNLVKTGIYSKIRHPLYLSLFLLGTGIMLKDPGTIQIILGVINLTAVIVTSRIEEKEMISKFGKEYVKYISETKMFVPYVI